MSFDGKEILLTGGAGGLGGLISRLITAEGGRVTVLDRTEPAGGLQFLRQDLSTPEGIEAAAEAVAARDWDIIVNLAGIQHFGPLELQSPGHLMASYLVNLVAPVRLTLSLIHI